MHFKDPYTEQGVSYYVSKDELLDNIPLLISSNENLLLMNPIHEEEVYSVVLGLGFDKSPRPDGFTTHFYTSCWDMVKCDLCKMLN